jgi:DNA polymerase III sliding clamp (beta) subunit (PCNA family)
MKITVNREVFFKSLTTAMLGMGTTPFSAWEHLRIEVVDKSMNIYARNSELQVQSYCKALKADEDYEFCVPGKLFYDTIKSLTSEEINIKTDIKGKAFVTTIWIKGNKKKFTMTGIDPEHFSPFYSAKEMQYFTMPMKPFAGAVGIASTAVKKDAILTALSGVSIQVRNNKLQITGTTNFGGVKMVIGSPGDIPDMLLPKGAAVTLDALDVTPEIEVGSNGDHIIMKTGQATVTCVLLEHKFPNMDSFWEGMTPHNYITVERKEFLASVRRMNMFSRKEKERADYIALEISGDTMTLSCESAMQASSGHEELDIENNDFDDLTIGFSPKYLTGTLAGMNTDYVIFMATARDTSAFMMEKDGDNDFVHNWILAPVLID